MKFTDVTLKNKVNKTLLPRTSAHGCIFYAHKHHQKVQHEQMPQHIGGVETYVLQGRHRMVYQSSTTRLELRKMKEELGEDEVNEVECLKRALGERSGNLRGVDRKLRSKLSVLRASTSRSSS